ncbi:MAG: O-antigen ligase family protein [Dehalococcoidia bacterium]
MAIGVPLAWTDVVVAEYTLPKLLMLACGLLVSAAGLALSLRSGARFIRPTPLDIPLVVSAVALAVSAWYSQDRLISLTGRYNAYAYGVWAAVLYAAVYYLAAWLPGATERRRTIGVCLAAGGIVAFYGVLQVFGVEPFSLSSALPSGRAVSTIGSPVDLGAYLALLLPLALHQTREGARSRLSGGVCLFLMACALLGTVSRGALLSAAAGILAYLFLAGRLRLPRLGKAAWLGLAAAALISVGFVANRLAMRPAGMGDTARVEAWRGAWDIFSDHPWLGSGPDTFEQQFRAHKSEAFLKSRGPYHHHAHAHSDIMQALATTGLAGTGAYLYLLVALFLAARRALREPGRRGEAAALCGGLIALFVSSKFNPVSLEVLSQAALCAGLLCGASRSYKGRPAVTAGAWVSACLMLAVAGGSTAAALRRTFADRQVQAARIEMGFKRPDRVLHHLRRGIKLDACELNYRILLANQLVESARAAPSPAGSSALLQEAAQSGREAVRCHPSAVNSHYIYGFVSLIQAQLGQRERLPVAERELDRALRLDPTFPPLLNVRLQAAMLRGDQAKAAELRERMETLRALSNR